MRAIEGGRIFILCMASERERENAASNPLNMKLPPGKIFALVPPLAGRRIRNYYCTRVCVSQMRTMRRVTQPLTHGGGVRVTRGEENSRASERARERASRKASTEKIRYPST